MECDGYADRIGAKVGVWGGRRRTRGNASTLIPVQILNAPYQPYGGSADDPKKR